MNKWKRSYSLSTEWLYLIVYQTIKYINNYTRNYEKILETLQSVETRMNFLNQKRTPSVSDIELIIIDLTSEFMGIDSERDLFRKPPFTLISKIERNVYNRRKRGLFYYWGQLRKQIASQIISSNYYIVDSMPFEVCKLSRSSRCTIFVNKTMKILWWIQK